MLRAVSRFLLSHRHEPGECRFAFAAWHGFDSPLRKRSTIGTCHAGGHALWWEDEAGDPQAALAQLPPFLAERTEVHELRRFGDSVSGSPDRTGAPERPGVRIP
jgi:hypothetical protein